MARLAFLLLSALPLLLACDGGRSPSPVAQAPDLVVWSSHPEALVAEALAEFSDRTGLRAVWRRGGTGELLTLARAEPQERLDVLWGGGAESLAANADLFEPYVSPEAATIPPAYKDDEGRWTGFSVLPSVLVWNVRLVPPGQEPTSWRSLADPAFRGLVAFADPRTSGSAFTALATVRAALGDGFVIDLARNLDGKLREESTSVFSSVASGECLVGASFENGALEALRFGGDLRFAYPKEGTSLVPDGVAIFAGTERAAAARRFVDFVLGDDMAKVASLRYGRRSARSDAPAPHGAPSAASIRTLDYDVAAVAAERTGLIAAFIAAYESISP